MKKKVENSCVHCGSDCGKHPVMWNRMSFCCSGCEMVYQLIHENKLYNYYHLAETPGIRVEANELGDKYAFLEKEEIKESLISFREGSVLKVKFYIPVIHCASCIWLLENLRSLNRGIRHSFVNFTRKEVDITFNESEISLRELVELLHSIHYIPDLSYTRNGGDETGRSYKKLLYKLGVAGFVFINVMTYSLPAYFNGEPLDEKLQSLFSILSYLLVIPVVIYSASDYYLSAFKNIIKRSISIDLPIAIGIFVLFVVTSYEIVSGRGTGYCDSLAGLVFFLLVGKWYQGKTYEALSFDRNYKSYFPIAVTKINKQLEESVLLEEIKVEDELLIRSKELIPADAVLIEGEGRIDYSFVTGESAPVVKRVDDLIYAGGRQMGGMIRIRITKEVSQSHLTSLWNQDVTYEKPSDSLKSLSDRISKYFTLAIIAIALAGLLYWILSGDIRTAIFVFTAVLIVACPCALALSIPFTFGNSMRIFGKKGLYIKNSQVIERLSKIDTIVFDKTGTLTIPNENNVEYSGTELMKHEMDAVSSLARQSTHPLSIAISKYYKNGSYIPPEHVVEMAGRGIIGRVSGIELKIGSREFVTNSMGSERPAQTHVFISIGGDIRGYFKFNNQYREGIEKVLCTLDKEMELYLVSGDNDAERENLHHYFESENMYFNQSPSDKAAFIKALQKEGRTVLMTGDGLNDAGALMQSDVALTLADKVYHFSPASDAVLEADKFKDLAKFIRFTKTSLNIVKLSFLISFIYNIVGIAFALTGNLSPIIAAILMPLSSVSVVAFATFVTRSKGR